MFGKKQPTEAEKLGLAAIESIATSLADIAKSLQSIEPKIDTIYEAYKDLNISK